MRTPGSRVVTGLLPAVAVTLAAWGMAAGGCLRHDQREVTGPRIHWSVRIDEPSHGIAHVEGRLSAYENSGVSSIALDFLDLATEPSRLAAPSARTAAGGPVPVQSVPTRPGRFTLELAGRTGTVTVQYTIDPTYFPPGSQARGPTDARSRIAPELAIVRTTSLLPQVDLQDLEESVRFVLPEGWVAVTPWPARGDTLLLGSHADPTVDYLALGPFRLAEIAAGDRVIRIAMASGGVPLSLGEIASIFHAAVEVVGIPPPAEGNILTVAVVPTAFMQGGAAGRHSIVQSASPEVIAHEMFHWWNHSGLTTAEATWFREGLTNYYGIQLARASGAWTDEGAADCLADLEAEMRYLERDGASSLAEASRAYRYDPALRRLVYGKGTLFSLLLERQLSGAGRTLDEVTRALLAHGYQNLGNQDIRRVVSEVYNGLVDTTFDTYVSGVAELPALGLGVPMGRSGCARFLPEREPD